MTRRIQRKEADVPVFELSGGALCLDLANTERRIPPVREELRSYSDLLAWSLQSGILGEAEAGGLRRLAARAPGEAAKALDRTRSLRSAIYRAFSAIAAGGAPDDDDVASINDASVEAWNASRIVGRNGAYEWTLAPSGSGLDHARLAAARSAADLLTSGELPIVRECALETCAWLFLDRSKNHKRRWCDMKTCGNRSKARRHYERSRRAARKPRTTGGGSDPGTSDATK